MVWYLALRDQLKVLLYAETLRFLTTMAGGLTLLSIVVRVKWTLPIDQRATLYLQILDKPILSRIAHFLTFLGNSSTLIVLAILSGGVAVYFGERLAAIYICASLLSLPLNIVLKKIISRDRPGAEHARILPGPRWGYSYPSGHSMGSAAFYSFFAAQLYQHGWNQWWHVAVVITLALLPIGVGVSRIYLGAHWLSDVVGGWTGGVLVSFALMAMYSP